MLDRRKFSSKLAASGWLTAVLLAPLVGCASTERLQLEQPFAPASQKFVVLQTRTAAYSEAEGRAAMLLECPLPAAKDGPIAYSIYVEAPRAVGEFALSADASGAKAMMIQRVGALAGKSVFDTGRVVVTRAPFSTNLYKLELSVRAADATALSGTLRLTLGAEAVERFVAGYHSDVDALRDPTAGDGAITQPRVAVEAAPVEGQEDAAGAADVTASPP